MNDRAILKEIAAEITVSLLSITPGASTVFKLLPDTMQRTVDAAFGRDNTKTLEAVVHQTLKEVTDHLVAKLKADPGSEEYGTVLSAVSDFRRALAATPLDARLVAKALATPELLTDAIRANCPMEHAKWASKQRRHVFLIVLESFTSAILAIAPQVPTVRVALAVET